MTTPIENLEPTTDLSTAEGDTPPCATRVISRFVSLGYSQIMLSFSGGGDSGAIDQWMFLKERVFLTSDDMSIDMYSNENYAKNKVKASQVETGENVDLPNILIGKGIYTYGIPEEDLEGKGLEKNDINSFEDFVYNYLINVDFNGETYSHGCILLDLMSGIILNKSSVQIKVEENQEDQVIRIRNNFSVLSDSSLLDDL